MSFLAQIKLKFGGVVLSSWGKTKTIDFIWLQDKAARLPWPMLHNPLLNNFSFSFC